MLTKSAVRPIRACWLTVVAATGRLLRRIAQWNPCPCCFGLLIAETCYPFRLDHCAFAVAAPKHVVLVTDIDVVACCAMVVDLEARIIRLQKFLHRQSPFPKLVMNQVQDAVGTNLPVVMATAHCIH